jgi:hypothetical protein
MDMAREEDGSLTYRISREGRERGGKEERGRREAGGGRREEGYLFRTRNRIRFSGRPEGKEEVVEGGGRRRGEGGREVVEGGGGEERCGKGEGRREGGRRGYLLRTRNGIRISMPQLPVHIFPPRKHGTIFRDGKRPEGATRDLDGLVGGRKIDFHGGIRIFPLDGAMRGGYDHGMVDSTGERDLRRG